MCGTLFSEAVYAWRKLTGTWWFHNVRIIIGILHIHIPLLMVVEFGFVVSVRSGQVFSKLYDISETSLIVGIVTSSSSGAVTAAAIPVIIINSDCVNDSQARISINITVTLVLYTDGRTILVTHKTDHICLFLSPYCLLIADIKSP